MKISRLKIEKLKKRIFGIKGSKKIGEVNYPNILFPIFSIENKKGYKKRLLIISGEHGDEHAGVYANLKLMESKNLPNINITSLPLVNPSGFFTNQYTNIKGVEVYASYGKKKTQESKIIWNYLKNERFDICLCLHEDSETGKTYPNGFYVIECPKITKLSRFVVREVSKTFKVTSAKVLWGKRGHDNGVVLWKPTYPTNYLCPKLLAKKQVKFCLFSESPIFANRKGTKRTPLTKRIQIQSGIIEAVIKFLKTI